MATPAQVSGAPGDAQGAAIAPPSGWGTLLAAAVPFLLYVSTLSSASYWLDSGEFVEAAVELDIAHPPGHPLTSLWGKAWTLLPLGDLAARVALGQAVAAALGAALLYRGCAWTARAFGVREVRVELPVGLLGAWAWALGIGVWFQAVRPEVYALQGLVSLIALERLAYMQLRERCDARPLYAATFATGLGLANHYIMACFVMPALLAGALRVQRRRGLHVLAVCAGLGLLGMSVYVYLPLRAATRPPANLGDPQTLQNFFWVVSGKLYNKSVGKALVPLDQCFVDVQRVFLEHFSVALMLLALLGAYAGLRRGGTIARVTSVWLWVAGTVMLVKPLLGFDRTNPDSIAYMMAGMAGVSGLFSTGAFAILSFADHVGTRFVVPLWAACALVVGAACMYTLPSAELATFDATDRFDELRVRRVPTRSVVVATTPQTVFRHLEVAATERLRPDVTLVPLPFLSYPGFAARLLHDHPELGPLVQTFAQSARLDPAVLAELARQRPLLIELDPHLPMAAYGSLVPSGLFYAFVGPELAAQLQTGANALQTSRDQRLDQQLGAALRHETETKRQWLYLQFFSALFHATHADRGAALQALGRAQALFPQEPGLLQLRAAILEAQPGRPVDIGGFLRAADTSW